jgi:two-component system, chemotaxis family, CheB/CheR fusion protein
MTSVNEELQSTNEEMETSREEIQSINEELHTVNLELNGKVEQLDQSNSDLQNLFDSTRIAIVFLDRNLLIRNFTPAVTQIFNLISTDRGRPLTDIVSHLDQMDFDNDLRALLAQPEPLEKPVRSREGHRHYLMRILPYRNGRNEVEGLLLTFVDVTTLKTAEEQQHQLIGELNHRVKNMLAVVAALARQTLKKTSETPEYATFLGRLQALASAYDLLTRDGWGDVPLRDVLVSEMEPYIGRQEGRLVFEGRDVLLRPRAALALGMVIHELATNAVKYGALLVPEGRVTVTWEIGRWNRNAALLVHWREVGGPEVTVPSHESFGSKLISQQIRFELHGDAAVNYLPTGLEADFMVPIGETCESAGDSEDRENGT